MKTIIYYLSPLSPWAYMGHDRLLAIAARYGVHIEPRPFALNTQVFPVSGGLPLKQRSPQRQAYRLIELKRWSEYLGLPLNVHPAHFPVDDKLAALMLTAAIDTTDNDAVLGFLRALYQAVWVQDRNISDPDTVIRIAEECQLDGQALYQSRDKAMERYERYTQEAIDSNVFGAPWYVYNGEPFWGQDRIESLERAVARG